MPADYLTNAVRYLDQIGVTDILIPFFLIFVVVFAALSKSGIFKFGTNGDTNSRKFSMIVALALSLGVVISHVTRNFAYTRGVDVVSIINQAIPRVSVVLIAILFFLIMIGIFGWKGPQGNDGVSGIIAFLALLTVGYIFAAAAGFLPRGPGTFLYRLGPDTVALVVVLLIFGAIVYYITSPEKQQGEESVWKNISDGFKGLAGGKNE